eukprot:2762588-Prymnesium_polylepis.1
MLLACMLNAQDAKVGMAARRERVLQARPGEGGGDARQRVEPRVECAVAPAWVVEQPALRLQSSRHLAQPRSEGGRL